MTAVDLVEYVRNMLIMLGIPVQDPSIMLGDNMSMVLSTTRPGSPLRKKHLILTWHRVREAEAGGLVCVHHVPTNLNFADIGTKPLGPTKHGSLSRPLMFRKPIFISEEGNKRKMIKDSGDMEISEGDAMIKAMLVRYHYG